MRSTIKRQCCCTTTLLFANIGHTITCSGCGYLVTMFSENTLMYSLGPKPIEGVIHQKSTNLVFDDLPDGFKEGVTPKDIKNGYLDWLEELFGQSKNGPAEYLRAHALDKLKKLIDNATDEDEIDRHLERISELLAEDMAI